MQKSFSAVLVATLMAASGAVDAHGKLLDSSPANGAAVSPAPTTLKLQFSEPVEAAISSVKLVGPGNQEVALEKPRSGKDDHRTLEVAVPKLEAGDYTAQWSTAGHDGHRVKGEIRFTVR